MRKLEYDYVRALYMGGYWATSTLYNRWTASHYWEADKRGWKRNHIVYRYFLERKR